MKIYIIISFIFLILVILNAFLLYLLTRERDKLSTLSKSNQSREKLISFFNELANLFVRYNKNRHERINNFLEIIRTYYNCESAGIILINGIKRTFSIKDIFISGDINGLKGVENINVAIHEYLKIVAEKNHPLRIESAGNIKNMIIIPINHGNSMTGAMFLLNKTNDNFSQEDEDNLISAASYATAILESLDLSKRLEEFSQLDVLTGLQNHRVFMERLALEIERAKRFNREFSIVIIDVDNFTKFNETFGYHSGDEMLSKIGGILKRNIRLTDLASRYGGESFSLLLTETPTDVALIVAERIRSAINSLRLDNRASPSITMSAGISSFPSDARDALGLTDAALKALYYAKQRGKNRIFSYRTIKQFV